MEKLLVRDVEWKGFRRWGGTVFLQGRQQVGGPNYVVETESHCGQSRVRPWPTDRSQANLLAMTGRAF